MPKLRDPQSLLTKATGIGPDPNQDIKQRFPSWFDPEGNLIVTAGDAPLPFGSPQAFEEFARRAQDMGKRTIKTLRDAGYNVPKTGFRSTADIDRMMAHPPVSSPEPAGWDQFQKYVQKLVGK